MRREQIINATNAPWPQTQLRISTSSRLVFIEGSHR